jgi:hypothetical protein
MARQKRSSRLARSFNNVFLGRLNKSRGLTRRRAVSVQPTSAVLESLETRQLLAAAPIAGLSDEFDDASTVNQWERVNEVEGWNADQLNVFDVDSTQAGRMVQEPHTAVWFQNWRGPMAFQTVTGDFSITTEVHITDRDDVGGSDLDDVPGDGQFSLAGAMIRTPRDITDPTTDWAPGSMADDGTNDGENYVFLSAGYGNGTNEFSLEVKTTRNSNSQLELTPLGTEANSATVQISRIGTSIITMYQLPGEEWQVHRRYSRPDMPATLQVGLVSYTDWTKANDFDPFVQNSTVLIPNGAAGDPTPSEAFNPDITAGFEYARYVRPDVPEAFAASDLTDPNAVSDTELLSFLGASANVVATVEEAPAQFEGLAPEDIVVFGDSILDQHTILLDESTVPESFNGQETNGPNVAQLLAGVFGIDSALPNNHAAGGETSGQALTRARHFIAEDGGTVSSSALYFIEGGYNDFNDFGTDPAVITQMALNQRNTIRELANAGATHFVVPNLLEVALDPANVTAGAAAQALLFEAVDAFNALQATDLDELEMDLGLSIARPDWNLLHNNVVADPEAYRLLEVTNYSFDGSSSTIHSFTDFFLNWDIHPSRAFNAILVGMGAAGPTTGSVLDSMGIVHNPGSVDVDLTGLGQTELVLSTTFQGHSGTWRAPIGIAPATYEDTLRVNATGSPFNLAVRNDLGEFANDGTLDSIFIESSADGSQLLAYANSRPILVAPSDDVGRVSLFGSTDADTLDASRLIGRAVTLIGGGGNDVLIGTSLNDTLVVSSDDYVRVNGGDGELDRLQLRDGVTTLDLTVDVSEFFSPSVRPGEEGFSFENIEIIDASNESAQTLNINADAVYQSSTTTDRLIVRVDELDTVTIDPLLVEFDVSAFEGDPDIFEGENYIVYSTGIPFTEGEATLLVSDLTTPEDPEADSPAPEMAVGMNLGMVNDWSHSWVFRDAFKLARTFTTRSLNTTTYEYGWNGPPEMDADGWVTSLPADTVNANGETIVYFASSILFPAGGNPAGVYRAEWSGEGNITFGAIPLETGTTEDGRSYALLEVAEDQTLFIRSGETNPDDYIRDIQIFMPDHAGQSLEMDNWQPGSDESPFHPLFLERLQPFETIRFMQWQQVNSDGRDLLTADDLRPASHANQGSTDRSSYNGVSMEYQVQLVNELGADGWFNMPHQADDSYVRAFAEHVRDNLHEDGVAYIEWSNEIWNFAPGFEANAWVRDQLELPQNAGLGFVDVWAQEARRDFEIWSDVFAGQEDRLVRVAAGQQYNPSLTNRVLESMDGEFDAVSSTSYAGLGTSNIDWVDETTTQDDIIDWVLENSVQWSLQTQAAHVEMAEQYSQELGRDIPFITYEGGSHLDGFGTEYQELIHSVQDNPRFREIYETLLHGMEQIGVDMHTQYVFTSQGVPTQWGEFGVLHEMDIPLEDAHEYNALVDFINGDLQAPESAVSIVSTNDSLHELGDTGEFTVTRTGLSFEEVTVSYSISGTATNGTDYEILSGEVLIPAGQTSATIDVTPLMDSMVANDEGDETITLTILDGQDYVAALSNAATATIFDNAFPTIPDQTMSGSLDVLTIDLPTELNGQSLIYMVAIDQNVAATLNAEHNFYTFSANHALNWGGFNEKWIQGNGGSYYYILPTGALHQWGGSFEDSVQLANVGSQFYDNPDLLVTVEPVDATVMISSNGSTTSLAIDPGDEFTGTFDVQLMAAMSGMVTTQTFSVTVINSNSAPVIEDIDDATLFAGGQSVEIVLAATDADGDALTYSVSVLENLAFELLEEHGLNSNGDYGLNWGGMQEKWLRGDTGSGWYFLLPDGSLNLWNGSFDTSEQLAQLSTDHYDEPTLLLEAQAVDLTYSVDGDVLTVTSSTQTGTFHFTATASDGSANSGSFFDVVVQSSILVVDIDDQTIESGASAVLSLPSVNPENGLSISYDIEVVDELSALNQEHGFYSNGNFYTNYQGNNERWIRDASNAWHYLMPNGDLFRWEGSFESSTLLAELGSEVYDDPTMLTDAQPLVVSIVQQNGVITITPPEGFVGELTIRVTATDGVSTTTESARLTVTGASIGAIDTVFENWAGTE